MFFFGYTFAGWMHLVVSSVCVLMVIAVAARALMILFIFLCGSWWKPLKNTGSLFFFHLGMYFNKGMDSIMEV